VEEEVFDLVAAEPSTAVAELRKLLGQSVACVASSTRAAASPLSHAESASFVIPTIIHAVKLSADGTFQHTLENRMFTGDAVFTRDGVFSSHNLHM
jgi:hypothetical protein